MGVAPVFDTGCAFPTFDIVKPALCTPSQCEAFRMSGKINVLEYEDRPVFKSEGTFIPETIEAALESGYKPPYCRMAISAGMGECLPLTTSRAKPTSCSSACSTGFCLSRMVFIPPLRLELVHPLTRGSLNGLDQRTVKLKGFLFSD